ncbi:MAG: HNH endonuclease signature motif containing protein [Caldilineaceae bacterium]|nr:HNH endonuclease signature motif containing protein [Caldilineaceae bacterium]
MDLANKDLSPDYPIRRQSLCRCSSRQPLLRLWHAAPSPPARPPPATLRGYDKRLRRIQNAVLAEEHLCRHSAGAGRVTEAVLVNHIVPLPAGTHDRENLQPLCQQCHAVMTASERQREG